MMHSTDETYNGWTNRDTWLVPLWIDNDYSTYQAKLHLLESLGRPCTAEDALSITRTVLGDQFDHRIPEVHTGPLADGCKPSKVCWSSIAEHWEAERLEQIEYATE